MRIPGRRRRPQLPDDAARELGVTGERVLAWAELAGGGVAAATPEGLRVRTPQGRLVRRPWTEVDHAAWDEDSGTLAVWWVGSRLPTPLEVGQETFLPEVVHERVRSSIVLVRELPLPGGRAIFVSLRKAADGTLSTHAVAPRGIRLDDPPIAAQVARVQRELREEAGDAL
ncbi:MAG TPA: hypothetical protein VEV65_00205 [Kineosporiaceae bacterium]|nr:hypothetical protein [Kineosporiaceae bacterium]